MNEEKEEKCKWCKYEDTDMCNVCKSLAEVGKDFSDVAKALTQVAEPLIDFVRDLRESLKKCSEQYELNELKEITVLESRLKHCDNYMERLSIERRLNVVKYQRNKKKNENK